MGCRCYTVIRALLLLSAISALLFALLGVFMPFFVVPSTITATLEELNKTILAASYRYENDTTALKRFSTLVSGPPANTSMTLWTVIYPAKNGTISVQLRDQYFSCYRGCMLIQAAEALSLVTCVLAVANVIMCMFMFVFAAVVKFPLALYFLFAAATAVMVVAAALDLYLHGWCSSPSLKDGGWNLTTGFGLYVASSALSLVACILTVFAG